MAEFATVSLSEWVKYRDTLKKLSEAAANEFRDAVFMDSGFFHGVGLGKIPRDQLIDYAYSLVTKYSEGSTALACEMYDELAALSGADVPPAVPAETATVSEVAKTVNGVTKLSEGQDLLADALGRLVKQAGQDTTLQNALRDGAQVAWVPAGKTCPFCLMLASRGYTTVSDEILEKGHATHIHSHCDCAYAVRHDTTSTVEGYNPAKYRRIYDDAEGATGREKVNAMRREMYAIEHGKNRNAAAMKWLNVFKD